MAAPYEPLRTASSRRPWPHDRADIRLPSSERSPLVGAAAPARRSRRAARPDRLRRSPTSTATAFRDGAGGEIGLLDAFYFGAVSVTSTGYGDITPVTDGARLVNIFVVMPARRAVPRHPGVARRSRCWPSGRAPSTARSSGGGPCRTTPSSAGTASRARPAVETLLRARRGGRTTIVVIDERGGGRRGGAPRRPRRHRRRRERGRRARGGRGRATPPRSSSRRTATTARC